MIAGDADRQGHGHGAEAYLQMWERRPGCAARAGARRGCRRRRRLQPGADTCRGRAGSGPADRSPRLGLERCGAARAGEPEARVPLRRLGARPQAPAAEGEANQAQEEQAAAGGPRSRCSTPGRVVLGLSALRNPRHAASARAKYRLRAPSGSMTGGQKRSGRGRRSVRGRRRASEVCGRGRCLPARGKGVRRGAPNRARLTGTAVTIPAPTSVSAMTRLPRIGAVAAVVLAGVVPPATSGRSRAGQLSAAPAVASELTTRQLAGSRIVCGFDGRTAPQSLLGAVSAGEIGGVIYFDDNIRSRAQLARMSAAIQAAPRPDPLKPPVIISVDQEGGQVKRLGGAPSASAEQMGRRGASYSRSQGARTAASLKGVGINVDLAPVLDVARPSGFIADQDRAFGTKPGRVASPGSRSRRACSRAGSPRPPSTSRASARPPPTPTCGPAKIPLSAGDPAQGRRGPVQGVLGRGREARHGQLGALPSFTRSGAAGLAVEGDRPGRAARPPRLRRRDDHGLARDASATQGASDAQVAIRAATAGMDLLLYVHCDAGGPGGEGAPQRARRRHARPRGIRGVGRPDPRSARRSVAQSGIV